MKKVSIIGYNIFSPGGTSRSNINLAQDFIDEGFQVDVYNTLPFTKKDIITLKYQEGFDQGISFYSINELGKKQGSELFIITRESLFKTAQVIKSCIPYAMVIGEIHGPLDLIDESIDLSLEYIDLIRVSTFSIQEEFKKRYSFDKVIHHTVSLRHIRRNHEYIAAKSTNLYIYSRFDEGEKDISYSIRLMDYLINYKKEDMIKLYINGYGPAEILYKNLINYYNLQKNVFLNSQIPQDSIYLSTSRFETFGYSIAESLAAGRKTLLFPGEDEVLKEIYPDSKSIKWLSKNVEEDAERVIEFVHEEKNIEHYQELHNLFHKTSYVAIYEQKRKQFCQEKRVKSSFFRKKIEIESVLADSVKPQKSPFRRIYSLHQHLKKWPVIRKIVTNPVVKERAIQLLNNLLSKEKNNEMELVNHYFFIESFHGKSFSGDPKYMALLIKKNYPKAKIFVSSANQLVDIEVRHFGLEPVRLGSTAYFQKYKQCKYIIVNGNTLDKAGKENQQIVIQTWHGFPLKKMVADIGDEKQRQEEKRQFLPRMKKWDYLISSSSLNTRLFRSAFKLDENPNLEILENGALRNAYLIENQDNSREKRRLHLKYFNRPLGKQRYILFCPTWRKDARKDITQIDLKKLIDKLPEDVEVIVKLHPLEGALRKYYKSIDERIHCFFNELVDIQELFLLSDILISDYSSAIFDFAHLNRKIIILQEDAEVYQKKIGWYFDIKKLCLIEGKVYNTETLVEAILKDDEQTLVYCRAIKKNLMEKDSIATGQIVLNKILRKWELNESSTS